MGKVENLPRQLSIGYALLFQISKPTPRRLTGIRDDGCYSTKALAEKLGVGIHTIYYWRQKGVLKAHQEYKGGPWWYQVTPEVLKTLRAKIRRVTLLSD